MANKKYPYHSALHNPIEVNGELDYFENNNDPILLGKNWEKGIMYSGFIELEKGEIFDPEKLKIHYDEVMVNDEIQCEIISKVEYDGNIIENSNMISTGYLLELTIES